MQGQDNNITCKAELLGRSKYIMNDDIGLYLDKFNYNRKS